MDSWRTRCGLGFATGALTSSLGPILALHLARWWPGLGAPPGLLLVRALTWLSLVAAGVHATR